MSLILSQKVCAGRIRTNAPTPGYNIQSLFRILPQHTVALRCAKSLELPQNGFLRGNQLMPSLFGAMRLRVDRDSVDLSRLSSPSGLAFLAGHDGDAPLGKITRAEIHDGIAYAYVRLESTSRSEPFLEELRQGIRDGISPGFMILAAEFVEEENDVVMLITRWQPYEVSSTPIPRMMSASLLRIDGSPSTSNKASLTDPSRVPPADPVDLSRSGKRAVVSHSVPDTVRGTRAAVQDGSHTPGRARVTEPTPTTVERAKRMSGIETRVDAKLADLSKREMALTDAEAAPATGAPLSLDETVLSLAALASNPSAPTPKMPGVVGAVVDPESCLRASTRLDAGRADRRDGLRERDTVSDRTR